MLCSRQSKHSRPQKAAATLAATLVVQVRLSGSVSSQYLTALLMAAPLATGSQGVDIIITDELVSQPYVDMTVRLMERFGVQVPPAPAARHPARALLTTTAFPGPACWTCSWHAVPVLSWIC